MSRSGTRVSIGLPVFNGEAFLAQALDSILAQTYSKLELVISDNASTDGTQRICQEYAARDKRIRYYRNERNMGAAPNFNRVYHLSEGEYFKWAPYDDLIRPEFVERCVDVLDRDRSVVLCFTRATIIDESGTYVVDHNPGPDTTGLTPHDRFRNLILHPEYALQQMGVMRTDVLKKTSLYGSFPSSDEVLLAEIALLGRFFEIPDRLYVYRRHASQSSAVMKQRDRIPFFDTSLRGRILLPTWLYLFACLAAVQRAPLPGCERLLCYLTAARWVLMAPHLRALAKDLWLAATKTAGTRWGNAREALASKAQ